MESGALSEPEFAEFAKGVVPFLHVTTRIEGHPNDDLLSQKGFRGFPSLAFMNEEGEVIAKPGGRSVEDFRKTHEALQKYEDLKKRVEAGEEGLAFDLFVAEWDLGKLDWKQAKARAKKLGDLNAAQKTKVHKILVKAEIAHIAGNVNDEESFNKAATRFKEILVAGDAPMKGSAAQTFWYTLLQWADRNEDAELYAKAVNKMKKILGDAERYQRFYDQWDERLAEIQDKEPAKP